MGWLSKLFNLDLWTDESLGAVPAPIDTAEHVKTGEQSKNDAKNRLKLVLMHDRTQLSSEVLEKMREEIVEVISKYVEIDKEALEINLESESNTIALVANIPMMRMRAADVETARLEQLKEKSTEIDKTDQKPAEGTTPPANAKGKEEDDTADEQVDDLIKAVESSEAKGQDEVKKAST